ncbi:transcription initiation factor TFIIE alpha subunit [Coprinopsis sp. MPI-PUGE-AT-0042]|nr:transcription initiation factor TFIIE alpha subunit [Coprinopsis sp. MPI-PUGE-AT-0042]
MSTKEEQDTLRLLVQHVSRAFYEARFTIILDQLSRHPVLKDDELAGRVGLQPKELNKVIAVLANDALVKVFRQNELKEGAQRSVGKQYYYIDYEHFCNVVKWRIARMRHKIDHKLRNEIDNKGYICPQCKQAYTPLEADKLMDFSRGVFACEICQAELIDNENAASVQGSKDRMMRFNHQIRFIREGLQKSETMKLPKFDVAGWVQSNAVAEAEQRQKMNGGPGAAGGGANGVAGHGLKVAGSGPSRAEEGVGIIMVREGDGDDEEKKRREREKEAEQKRTQNALPAWHLKSTITGDLTALGIKESNRTAAQHPMGDESLRGLGVSGPSRHRTTTSAGTNGTVVKDATNGEDTKSNFDTDFYDRYYANLAAASTPGSSTFSVAPTPNYGMGDEDEDRKPNVEYLQSLNEYRKRSRSQEDIGAGSKTPKIIRTDSLGSFAEEAVVNQMSMDVDAPQGQLEDGGAPGDDPLVYVNGVPKALSLVTEEDHDLMTPEEYTTYFQVLEEHS